MKLELGKIFIEDVQFGEKTHVDGRILVIDHTELLEAIGGDEHLWKIRVDLAHPGESVRITPVKDVIEPRVKVKGHGAIFPGMLSKVDTVGNGRTHAMKNVAVVTAGKVVGFQEGIIDMSGPGADYTPFSKTHNVVITAEPKPGIKPHEHEAALRTLGLKAASFLGQAVKNVEPDEIRTYETLAPREAALLYPELPRVGYVYMLQTQGLLHDTYVYGVDAKKLVPTVMYPTEIMDGAIVSGNCVSACDKNPTYIHMNNPVIEDLYEEHGKTINFLGVIITNENVTLADKERSSNWTAKICEFMGLDGVIVTQEGFGNPDTDLIMNCRKIEEKGIKTVIVTDEYAGRDGASQSLADADPKANAVVTNGNANETIVLPYMQRLIGTTAFINSCAGGFDGSLREDGTIMVELQAITGATNETGFGYLSAAAY